MMPTPRRPGPQRRSFGLAFAIALALALAMLTLLGCPPASDDKTKKPPAPTTACTSFGQTCEVSPGKLGTCVSKEPCTGNDCLVCQSQH